MVTAYEMASLLSPGWVLGRRLRPLSAWHVAALDALGSPYFRGGEPCAADLCIAVDVCRSLWTLDSDSRALAITRTLRGNLRMTAWRVRLFYNMDRELSAMDAHIRAYLNWPEFWANGEAKKLRMHMAYHLVGTLLNNTTLSEERCWNMPINLAQCYAAAVAVNNGAECADGDLDEAERILKNA